MLRNHPIPVERSGRREPNAQGRRGIVYDLNTGREDRITLPSGATSRPSRSTNSLVYAEDLDRVFLFSGYQDMEPKLPTDIWLYDLNTNTWEKVGP